MKYEGSLTDGVVGAQGRLRRCRWLCAATVVVSVLSLLTYLTSWTEVVRMRNALLLVEGKESDFSWTPSTRPESFRLDDVPPYREFVDVVRRLDLDALPDDWSRAVAISAYLLTSSGQRLQGGAVQSDLRTTLRRIEREGQGYCADFVRVFSALAVTAGIPVRSWAFSFDGFGGHGHVFPEIWNRQAGRWQLVGVFNNLAFVGADGEPLSGLAFRSALLERRTDLQFRPLVPAARPGFVHPEKIRDYYERGAAQWYLWWGTHPFSYDSAWSVRLFDGKSRSLAQFGAILQGVHPGIHTVPTTQSVSYVASMVRLRWHLLAVGLLTALAALGAGACTIVLRARRGQGPSDEEGVANARDE